MSDVTEPLPGSDAIGRSYNVFGYFADPKSLMEELFDLGEERIISLEGRTWLLATDYIDYIAVRDTETQTLSIRSKDDYSRELAVKVKVTGGYGLFSASIEADFSDSVSNQSDSTYTSIRTNVNKWKLSLKYTSDQGLQSLLTPSFKEALATMEPQQLFDTFGTHYLGEVLVGGRADYVATTKTSAFSSDMNIRAAAEASFGSFIGMSVSADMKEEVEKFRSNSSSRLYALGGSALASITDPDTYKSWLASIDTLPVFCGFTQASLRPIWTLAESDQRRQILQRETESFTPSEIRRTEIVDLEVMITGDMDENPPYGFTKMDQPLIRCCLPATFVCYKRAKVAVAGSSAAHPKSITALHVAYGDHTNNYMPNIPQGFTKIDKNLNNLDWDVDAKVVYLCYSKDPDKADQQLPIRGLRVINDYATTPYGFEKIEIHLNNFGLTQITTLCYSRHFDN